MEVTVEQIQQLMEELGPAHDEITSVARNGDDVWSVQFEDETLVVLELDAEQGKLILSIDLGQPEESRRLEVYSSVLSYNYLWRDTGGVTIALADGELTQLFALNAVDLTLELLLDVLLNSAAKARLFKAYVAGNGEAPAASSDASEFDFPMMRV